ncbi:MAG: gamma-glutamylcyclotransferase [Burkholderiaceae bacterium]
MSAYVITRQSILDGTLLAAVQASLGPGQRLMSDEERRSDIQNLLAQSGQRGDVWVFAFGSLIWNPAFEFVEKQTARIHGWRRAFCLWNKAGRGSPDFPGLMLSLEAGGSCTGVIYRIAASAVLTELDVLWRREMLSYSYRPVWALAHTGQGPIPAIAFSRNPTHERYAPGLPHDLIVRHIAQAEGRLGRCCDYLFDTVDHLQQLGIRDRYLERIARDVRAIRTPAWRET